jgi:radical SAM protein with 4Fe4S-binding SPASM domain
MEQIFNRGPIELRITFTNRCSAKCVTCMVGSIPESDYSDLDTDIFKKCIHEILEMNNKNIKTVAFFSIGEAYLHEDFVDLVEWAIPLLKKRHIKTIIISNGSNISKIPNGIDTFIISFNAGKKESYEYITKLNFEKVYNNILRLYKTGEYKNAESFQIHMLCFDKNQDEENDFKLLFKDMKDVLLRFSYKYDNQFNMTTHQGIIKKGKKNPCNYLTNKINIHSNGDIILCAHDYLGSVVFGNLKYQKLKDILSSPARIEMIKSHNNLKFDGLCKNCDYNSVFDDNFLVYTWADERQERRRRFSRKIKIFFRYIKKRLHI